MIYNKIGFIGAGSIVQTMIKGFIKNKVIKTHKIWVTNKNNRSRLQELEERYNINCSEDKKMILNSTDVIILAVKPQDLKEVLLEIKPYINEKQMLISVVAGISTKTITSIIEKEIAVVRVMPNTSCAVSESATAISKGELANERHLETARELFETLGNAVIVDEQYMDLITGISGSGPAYFYYMVEKMQKTAISQGLSENIANKLIVQTIYGAAKMLMETNEDPALLRKKVTSPNGTTYAALQVFEEMNFEHMITNAVLKAAERATELGIESIKN